VSLQRGAFEYTVGASFKPGHKDATTDYRHDTATGFSGDSDNCTVDSPHRRASACATFDFQTKYDVDKALPVTGGVKSVFDRDPPFTLAAHCRCRGVELDNTPHRGARLG
jgi:iron complex outermembrane receptor protein